MLISSRSNATVKQIRALRSRKERERSGSFFVESIRIVAEAIDLGASIESYVVAPELLSSDYADQLIRRMDDAAIQRVEVTADVFRSLSTKEGPQGIGLVVRQQWESLGKLDLVDDRCWVALDSVQDPGNLGTILRTSDAVGNGGVVLIGATTDPYDPVSLRASMGAIFSQRLMRSTTEQFADWKRKTGCRVIGTSDAASRDYQDVTYTPPLILWMGSERMGLSLEQQTICDEMVRIPMVGRSDSLNLAVATGIVLYEIFNQYRHRHPEIRPRYRQ